MGSNDEWSAERVLHKYLYDYMVKKNMHNAAELFAIEANADVSPVVSAVDFPESFLAEWWSIFHDMYFHPQANYVETAEKGKQVAGTTTEIPCSEASKCGINLQNSVHDCDSLLAQLSSKTCEGAHQKHTTKKFDINSQTSSEMQSSSKLAGSGPSNSLRNPRKQGQQRQDKKRVASLRSTPIGSSTGAETQAIGLETALNSAPLEGRPLVGGSQLPPCLGHQVLDSYLQSANSQQQVNLPVSQSQQEIFTQILARTPSSAPSSFSLPSDYIRNGIERTSVLGGKNEEKKGSDESIETLFSQYVDHADWTSTPQKLLNPSTTYEKYGHTGMSLVEVGNLQACEGKIFSSNFSPDGKLLACVGQDKKVLIWNMNTNKYNISMETHAHLITDVRFHPTSEFFATSSFDKTVQLWNATEPCKSLFALSGHDDYVMSLDFHPRKTDLLCSSDSNDVLRFWNIKECSCLHVSKGATGQVRFQPQLGRFLAAVSRNVVNIINVETRGLEFDLKGHQCEVRSICWDVTGNFIASVSEESVRLWSISSGGRCIYEFHSKGHSFQSCTFHPAHPLLLVIGSYQLLCLWNPSQTSSVDTILAHNGLIPSLASSATTGLIASAGHDQGIKLWR